MLYVGISESSLRVCPFTRLRTAFPIHLIEGRFSGRAIYSTPGLRSLTFVPIAIPLCRFDCPRDHDDAFPTCRKCRAVAKESLSAMPLQTARDCGCLPEHILGTANCARLRLSIGAYPRHVPIRPSENGSIPQGADNASRVVIVRRSCADIEALLFVPIVEYVQRHTYSLKPRYW